MAEIKPWHSQKKKTGLVQNPDSAIRPTIGKQMHLSLHQRQTMDCPVCGQDFDRAAQNETFVDVDLFGAESYAVCPECFQRVPEERKTESYRKLWEILVRARRQSVQFRSAEKKTCRTCRRQIFADRQIWLTHPDQERSMGLCPECHQRLDGHPLTVKEYSSLGSRPRKSKSARYHA